MATPVPTGLVEATPAQIKRLTGVDVQKLRAQPMQSSCVTYDHTFAEEAIKFVVPARQRRKKPAHIDNLTSTMHRDEFDPTGDSLVYGILPHANGKYDMLLDNGQHRMHALSRTPSKKYLFPVVVRLFKNDDARRQWFALQDRGRVRTAADQSRILGLDKSIIQLTEKTWLSQILAAMKWIGNGLLNTKDITAAQQTALLAKYGPAMKRYHELASYSPPRKKKGVSHPANVMAGMKWAEKMRAAPAIAVFVVLLDTDAESAETMLKRIREFALGHASVDNSPVGKLYKQLIGATYAAGADRTENIRKTVELIQAARGRPAPYINWAETFPLKASLEG